VIECFRSSYSNVLKFSQRLGWTKVPLMPIEDVALAPSWIMTVSYLCMVRD